MREVVLGDGYGSQNSLRQYFGLNDAAAVDEMVVPLAAVGSCPEVPERGGEQDRAGYRGFRCARGEKYTSANEREKVPAARGAADRRGLPCAADASVPGDRWFEDVTAEGRRGCTSIPTASSRIPTPTSWPAIRRWARRRRWPTMMATASTIVFVTDSQETARTTSITTTAISPSPTSPRRPAWRMATTRERLGRRAVARLQ